MLLRTADPIHLTLAPWTTRSDAKQLQAAKTELEDTVRAAAASPASDVKGSWLTARRAARMGAGVEPAGDDAVSLDGLKKDS